MACGLPVVSFNCPGGVSEIVRDGVDGILVPPQDVEALACGLERLMGDDDFRRRLACKAPEVVERFSLDRCLEQWERLIDDLVESRRQAGTQSPS